MLLPCDDCVTASICCTLSHIYFCVSELIVCVPITNFYVFVTLSSESPHVQLSKRVAVLQEELNSPSKSKKRKVCTMYWFPHVLLWPCVHCTYLLRIALTLD